MLFLSKRLFMQPVEFPGSVLIKPLDGIFKKDEYMIVWAQAGKDRYGNDCLVTAWQPSKEDLDALNRGEPVYINITGKELPAINVFTLNEDGYSNDPGLDEDESDEEKFDLGDDNWKR